MTARTAAPPETVDLTGLALRVAAAAIVVEETPPADLTMPQAALTFNVLSEAFAALVGMSVTAALDYASGLAAEHLAGLPRTRAAVLPF